ncbi:DUF4168 domain-containing protein [Tranquillimonas alkanivorans]|uniref:DUF4168 domain-containing protein n=1 Tax=Tranquillimonas alkanivorans TaxID=441119 RepID=A0A1I5PRS9_9RHOB|nr:DUF4168 domain-containing protein [Tranquillimonas alkanivorans]SFP36679.1 protein of unknown function [Tranquillimonas alkanivorans]
MTFRTYIATLSTTAALALAAPLSAQQATDDGMNMNDADSGMMQSSDGEMMNTQDDMSGMPEGEATADAGGTDFSDEQLDAFVVAAIEVAELQQSYSGDIQQAADENERRQLIEDANEEMRQAIENADGITVEEYIAIGEASTTDEALNERITAMLRERMSEQMPQDDGEG